ncbi:MAG: M14 family metallopeptidase [Symbiobacteriaceae bacterium]|nr:M14 family metallopeptidase [Symbiobacteriaceae bacterium]
MKVPYEAAKYYTWDEIKQLIADWCTAFPQLVRSYPIGKTYEGREIICMEITAPNHPAAEKPGYYIDANFHAGEVTGSAVALYTASWLLENYGSDPEATELLERISWYIVPRVSIDGSEMYLHTPFTLRSSTRLFPHSEDQPGLHAEDVNGDGWIAQMRIEDPHGDWKVSQSDPRLMVRRQPDDMGGTYYRVYQEGRIVEFDGIEVHPARSRWGLDVNRNMPAFWDIDAKQIGSGDYALSEPETKAIADFLIRQKNIAGAMSYHTSGNVHLRPCCTIPDAQMVKDDFEAYKLLGTLGAELTGYGHCSVYDGFTADKNNPLRGVYLDWIYNHRGILSWSTELWSIQVAAGCEKPKFEGPRQPKSDKEQEADMLKVFAWHDQESLDGFLAWESYEHPQLGTVEIGGWKSKYTFQNPPPQFLPELCEKNMRFTNMQAKAMAFLAIRKVKVEKLTDGLYKITCGIVNGGYLNSAGTTLATRIRVTKPVEATLCGEGVTIAQGKAKLDLGHLSGRSEKKAEWLIQGNPGSEVTISVCGERAGTTKHVLHLP